MEKAQKCVYGPIYQELKSAANEAAVAVFVCTIVELLCNRWTELCAILPANVFQQMVGEANWTTISRVPTTSSLVGICRSCREKSRVKK